MARDLAAMGFVVLRFDFSGIGDSEVYDDNPFEKSAISETQEAMDFLSVARGVERFVLIGICSGADISFQTACCDPRVVGAIPINAQDYQLGMSEEWSSAITSHKHARYYWRIALFNPKSWLKAIKGKADYWSITRAIGLQLGNLLAPRKKMSSEANHIAAGFHSLIERGAHLLLVYSEGDAGLDYLDLTLSDKIHELSSCGKLQVEIISQTDHIFTLLNTQRYLLTVVQEWLTSLVGESPKEAEP
jgi:pimeloyl-ACP methyl ester carboxylesterase